MQQTAIIYSIGKESIYITQQNIQVGFFKEPGDLLVSCAAMAETLLN